MDDGDQGGLPSAQQPTNPNNSPSHRRWPLALSQPDTQGAETSVLALGPPHMADM